MEIRTTKQHSNKIENLTVVSNNPEKKFLEVGYKYKIFYNKGNINNKTIHIRAIVDEDRVVYAWWSKNKQRWIYEIDTLYFFELTEKNMKKLGKTK